jgi:hypothetical protein
MADWNASRELPPAKSRFAKIGAAPQTFQTQAAGPARNRKIAAEYLSENRKNKVIHQSIFQHAAQHG